MSLQRISGSTPRRNRSSGPMRLLEAMVACFGLAATTTLYAVR